MMTDITRELVSFHNAGISNKQITELILEEWRDSDTIKDMLTAQEYYEVRNEAIQEKTRDYLDSKGVRVKNDTLSNVHLPTGFLRKNVIKKVNYAFGKPFTLSVENLTQEEQKNDIEGDRYLKEWQRLIDDKFINTIGRIGTEAINKGIGWGYVWIDENGQLRLITVKSETIYPQWKDIEHTELDALVRDYMMVMYEGEQPVEIWRVEFWDKDTVERYVQEERGGELEDDTIPIEGQPEQGNSHMRRPVTFSNPETGEGEVIEWQDMSWGKIPFIPLKGTEDELPLLNTVKDRIDAYDMLDSKSVDSLIDDIDPALVLENISPEIGGLIKAREMLKNSRIISLDSGGKAYYVQVNANITANMQQKESLRRDIREFSADVDTQDIKMGSNPSGVALKSMYQDLDTYINGVEKSFRTFMQEFKYFFDRWLEFRGIGTAEQWSEYKVIVELNRDMLINESELFNQAQSLASIGASQETVFNYAPGIISPEIEFNRLAAERERNMEIMQQQSELMQFANVLGGGEQDDSGLEIAQEEEDDA